MTEVCTDLKNSYRDSETLELLKVRLQPKLNTASLCLDEYDFLHGKIDTFQHLEKKSLSFFSKIKGLKALPSEIFVIFITC